MLHARLPPASLRNRLDQPARIARRLCVRPVPF